jgi:hypothetical protein
VGFPISPDEHFNVNMLCATEGSAVNNFQKTNNKLQSNYNDRNSKSQTFSGLTAVSSTLLSHHHFITVAAQSSRISHLNLRSLGFHQA